ncbi:unnamed protein product [Didymodactylos carnosus]|uniref:Ankyrin repeat protein n=1 Tax=Didymodactylos carnosus TaxID=1234261 RepID=A0A815WMP9_9BILA|nr:unnamed protein product [Didymodactylos carnosus]CAF4406081.1 unnamed protein product [Didymodactylos carnosus]
MIKHENSIFYNACRSNNIDYIAKYAGSMTIDEINCIEPNGSTALHTACHFGHMKIVQILLENGASRSIRNRLTNLTAYEETDNEYIRSLFRLIVNIVPNNDEHNNNETEPSYDYAGTVQWVLTETKEQFLNMNHQYLLKQYFDVGFKQMVQFLIQFYLNIHALNHGLTNKLLIENLFRQSLEELRAVYLIICCSTTTETKRDVLIVRHLFSFV